jgi:hypothetical protein
MKLSWDSDLQSFSFGTRDDNDHYFRSPSFLERPCCVATRHTRSQYVVDQENRAAGQLTTGSGEKGAAHHILPFRTPLFSQAVGCDHASERLMNPKVQTTRQAVRQCVGLVVASFPATPPVERDRDDQGVTWQVADCRSPCLSHKFPEPGGEPGIPLVLQTQTKIAKVALIRAQRECSVKA